MARFETILKTIHSRYRDLGESGEMEDDDDVKAKPSHNVGCRTAETDEIEENDPPNEIDCAGESSVKESKGDKKNLMRHGEHTSAHPGFKAIQSRIASRQGLSKKAAGAILAARSRGASGAAKRSNPRLKRVKG